LIFYPKLLTFPKTMKLFSVLLCGVSVLGSLIVSLGAHASPVDDRVADLAAEALAGSTVALNQKSTPAEQERQRQAERNVIEAERIRRENQNPVPPQDSSYQERQRIQEETNREVERLRQGVTDPQRVRESQAELERLRQQRINVDRYYDINRHYYWDADRHGYSDGWVVPGSGVGTTEGSGYQGGSVQPAESTTPERVTQYDYSNPSARSSSGTFSVSAGFQNGNVNPAIGYRLPDSNIGFEVGAIFDIDRLPAGNLLDFPIGSAALDEFRDFNNLGIKKLTPNIGGDVIGYYDVSPQVSLFGGLGVYFQSSSLIVQSTLANNLFKETNTTNVSLAVSGGADFRVSNSLRIGAGYHSIRGVTARIGYEF
jgi:opacity protein-like surface antigen